jgi:hypothetical protein
MVENNKMAASIVQEGHGRQRDSTTHGLSLWEDATDSMYMYMYMYMYVVPQQPTQYM